MPTQTPPPRADALDAVLHCKSLPTLPAVALRVLELTSDPEVTLPQLAAVIRGDQGLSAKLLQTVNASFYGVRHKCSTVNQAVALLGIGAVKCLSLGFSLVGALKSDADDNFDYPAYWRRSLVTALAAKRIAAAAGLAVEDEAFVGGLLQDIGMIAALRALGAPYGDLVRRAGPHAKLAEHELEALGAQHAEMGAALARMWGLPDDLSVPIRFHERPSAAPAEHRRLAQCVALGNLVHEAISLDGGAEAHAAFVRQAHAALNLKEAECAVITRETADAAREAAGLLHIEIGRSADVGAMLAEAERLRVAIADTPDTSAEPEGLAALVRDGRLRDPLTGALTRPEFECRLSAAFEQTLAGGAPVSLVIARIDGYDHVLAVRGQEILDVALVETAHALEHLLRPPGAAEVIVGRWEEGALAAALVGPQRDSATRLAMRCDEELGLLSAGWRGRPDQPAVTLSLGLAIADDASASTYRRTELLLHAASKAAEAPRAEGGSRLRMFKPRRAA